MSIKIEKSRAQGDLMGKFSNNIYYNNDTIIFSYRKMEDRRPKEFYDELQNNLGDIAARRAELDNELKRSKQLNEYVKKLDDKINDLENKTQTLMQAYDQLVKKMKH